MPFAIHPIRPDQLAAYARVPMTVQVRSVLAVETLQPGELAETWRERPISVPYLKNYDVYADGGPLDWPGRFDLTHWGLWLAKDNEDIIGAAAVAWNTPGVDMLEGRRDLAVLWDLRVRDSHRRQGVGAALFHEAARWARSKGCTVLKIETQTVNVGACRFYARMGCSLVHVNPTAYRHDPAIASEVMLIWHLDLAGG